MQQARTMMQNLQEVQVNSSKMVQTLRVLRMHVPTRNHHEKDSQGSW